MLPLHIDTSAVRAALKDYELRQYPYAASRALNDTTDRLQALQQGGIRRRFTISPRRERFMTNMVFFDKADRSTKTNLRTVLQIKSPESLKQASANREELLTRHEDGGVKRARHPDHPFAIPTDVLRPGATDEVAQRFFPKALRLQARRDVDGVLAATGRATRAGGVQLQGKRRTFVIDTRRGIGDPRAWGVYQRQGRGKSSRVRMLWAYRSRITLRRRLGFQETADRHLLPMFRQELARWMTEALRTAK